MYGHIHGYHVHLRGVPHHVSTGIGITRYSSVQQMAWTVYNSNLADGFITFTCGMERLLFLHADCCSSTTTTMGEVRRGRKHRQTRGHQSTKSQILLVQINVLRQEDSSQGCWTETITTQDCITKHNRCSDWHNDIGDLLLVFADVATAYLECIIML